MSRARSRLRTIVAAGAAAIAVGGLFLMPARAGADQALGQPGQRPAQAQGQLPTFRSVSTGTSYTCGIRIGGTLWCWGDNSYGEGGNGDDTSDAYSPVRVGVGANWAAVSGGDGDTCAIRYDRTQWCWGDDYYGELGNGEGAFLPTPLPVR